jgi:ribokinase
MYDVVTVGSAVVDILVKSDQFKIMKSHQLEGGVALCEVYGGKTEVENITLTTGGGAMNAAVSMARKGLLVAPIVKIGNDWAAELILKSVRDERLGKNLLITDAGDTGMSVVLIGPDGGRSILTHRGIAGDIIPNEINWQECLGVRWFYVASTGGNKTFLEDAFSIAKKNGTKIAFNPGRGELAWGIELKRFLTKIEVLIINKSEITTWLGIEFDDKNELTRQIRELNIPFVVITEGNKGASVYHGGVVTKADAFDVKSVDDTGAGDAFGSSFVYGLSQEWNIEKALKFASANAASVVQKVGATDGLLSLETYKKWSDKNLVIEESRY